MSVRCTSETLQTSAIIDVTRKWVRSFVIELNLCPFANRELLKDRIRFIACDASTEEQLLIALQSELELLEKSPQIETTLLIHAKVLQDFYDYNEFLESADKLLIEMKLRGIYQIASFHPDYQFSRTEPNDLENYTNRSPHPMLHILREDSLELAIENYPEIDQIPARNIELMNSLGQSKLDALIREYQTK